MRSFNIIKYGRITYVTVILQCGFNVADNLARHRRSPQSKIRSALFTGNFLVGMMGDMDELHCRRFSVDKGRCWDGAAVSYADNTTRLVISVRRTPRWKYLTWDFPSDDTWPKLPSTWGDAMALLPNFPTSFLAKWSWAKIWLPPSTHSNIPKHFQSNKSKLKLFWVHFNHLQWPNIVVFTRKSPVKSQVC